MGIEWIGVVLGLGFVLSFGYWTTDFLVAQRALASENLFYARRTPIIAAFPKMLVPIIVVIPGLVAISVLLQFSATSENPDYNSALILLMTHHLPNGVSGLAITALPASFMSDQHYFKMRKYATVFGVFLSIGSAYIVQSLPNLMDYMQLIFSFFNAPLFATFLLGMFWKRATEWGGFFGLVSGIFTAAIHYLIYKFNIIHYPLRWEQTIIKHGGHGLQIFQSQYL